MKENSSQSLTHNEELYSLIVENIEDFAIFAIDLEGRNASWNPGVQKLLGYSEEEFIGLPCSIIFTPEDVAIGGHEYEMRTAAEKGRAEDERWHVKKDGSRFWASGLMMSLRRGRGAPGLRQSDPRLHGAKAPGGPG